MYYWLSVHVLLTEYSRITDWVFTFYWLSIHVLMIECSCITDWVFRYYWLSIHVLLTEYSRITDWVFTFYWLSVHVLLTVYSRITDCVFMYYWLSIHVSPLSHYLSLQMSTLSKHQSSVYSCVRSNGPMLSETRMPNINPYPWSRSVRTSNYSSALYRCLRTPRGRLQTRTDIWTRLRQDL